MGKIVRVIEAFVGFVSGHVQAWLIFLLMWMVLVEVLSRYVLLSPLAVSNEIGGFVLVCITFMGLAYTWRERGHVRVEFIFKMFPLRLRWWVRFVSVILALLFALILIKAGYDFIEDSLFFQERSERLRIPLFWPQLALISGSALLFLQLVAEILKMILGRTSYKGDE
ncbi:MAG: TRAP transporter small permease [Desulfohalobiaceae bacterium]|nr:TRAP transporter small permease [Desulfohalobiaceae bacterium]